MNFLKFSYNVIKPNLFLTNITRNCSLNVNTQIIKENQTLINTQEPDKLYNNVELEMRGHDPAVLKSYAWFLNYAAEHLGIEVTNNYALRKSEKERHTLLKSVHIYKKHRVQYEIRTYFRFFNMRHLTGSTADTYLEYIERNLPEGVSLKITKVELQELPSHLKEKPEQT